MSLRRFVNLFVENRENGFYSLRRINLSRHQLFYPTVAAASHAQGLPIQGEQRDSSYQTKLNGKKNKQAAALEVESIRPPVPTLSMRPTPFPTGAGGECKMDCFPLSESKIICTDQATNTFLYDADERSLVNMPNLHAPKVDPISLSIAGHADADGQQESSIYVMESVLLPESFQFEAFVYRKKPYSNVKAWQCDPLPLPPYVDDPGYLPTSIDSYAVVGDVICVSTEDIGTYCFNTVSRTWSQAGDWTLPFYGKVEYVPELNLWFGIAADFNCVLCASDLSPIVSGQPPKLRYVWEDLNLPEEWQPNRSSKSKLLSLGSGRFCITNFFRSMKDSHYMDSPYMDSPYKDSHYMDSHYMDSPYMDSPYIDDKIIDQIFAVFTGVEVLPGGDRKPARNGNGKGKGGLRMIKHMSRRYTFLSTNVIESVL